MGELIWFEIVNTSRNILLVVMWHLKMVDFKSNENEIEVLVRRPRILKQSLIHFLWKKLMNSTNGLDYRFKSLISC